MPDKYTDKPTYWYQDMVISWDDFTDHCSGDDSVCDNCGCPNVEEQITRWYQVNSGDYCSDGENDPYYYCPYCECSDIHLEDFGNWIEEHESKFFTKGDK